METVLVSGVTYNKDEAKISVMRVPDKPGIAAKLFSPLSESNISVDMIIQNVSHEGFTDLTFTVPRADFKKALKIVEEAAVVIGAGGVGLNAIQGARIAGARRIVAVDINEAKLADAAGFGATDGILATGEAPWRALVDKIGRKADAVFVTVGAIPAYDTAPRYLAPGGKVVMVGMPASGALSSYQPDIFASLSQGMVGSKMGNVVLSRDIPWLVDLYQQGRLQLDELISKRWPLDEVNEAIADTKGGAARRNVIVF